MESTSNTGVAFVSPFSPSTSHPSRWRPGRTVSIHNANGQVVTRAAGRATVAISTAALPAGLYTVTVKTADGVFGQRLIKR